MKFKWLYFFVLIIVLLLGFYTFLMNFRNSKIDTLSKVSKSVLESKKENAFVALYVVDEIDNNLELYLNKKELRHINLRAVDFWVEKVYHYYHKYIFFKKHIYSDELRLIIEDQTSLLKKDGGFPFIGFKLKGDSVYSGNNGMGGEVCVLNIGKSLPQSIELEVYFNHSNTEEDVYVGNIYLSLDVIK